MAEPVKIVLADDHPLIRRGLKASLEEDQTFVIIGEASNGDEALRQIMELDPQIAILDIDMPGMSGLSVAREIEKQELHTNVIFITFHLDESLMRNAMAAGGKGYLLKGSETDEIILALRAVHAGGTYIGSKMANLLRKNKSGLVDQKLGHDLKTLSVTEKTILRLIADGKSTKEIGDDLSTNYRTIENHRTRMCRKLNLEGANALLRFALQHRTALYEQLH